MKKMNRILAALMAVFMLTGGVSAVTCKPSVEIKAAPEVVLQKDEAGKDIVAIIRDKDGKEVAGIPYGELVVTPLSKVDVDEEHDDPAAKQMLKNAYNQILGTASLSDLVPGLEKVMKELGFTCSVDQLVIKDMFDISVYGTYAQMLEVEGNTVTVRLRTGVSRQTPMLALHNYQDNLWEAVSAGCTQRHENGDISLTFSRLSPVALVIDRDAQVDGPGETPVEPPKTSDESHVALWAALLVCSGSGIVLLLATRRKHGRS